MTDKKKGTAPYETAPNTDTADRIAFVAERERGEYLPLAWAQLGREVKPAPFRGKSKRKSRAATISAKRNQGAVTAELLRLIGPALAAGVLLGGAL